MNVVIKIQGQVCRVEGLTLPLIRLIDKELSYEVKNKDFITGDWDGVVHLFNCEFKTFNIGHLNIVRKLIKKYCVDNEVKGRLKIIDSRQIFERVDMSDGLKVVSPFAYQDECVDNFIKNKIGCIQAVTGAGKTIIAAECIRRLGLKTLFVVNRKVLLTQAKKSFEKFLGIEVGVIGDGKVDLKDVNVATIQSLNKNFGKLRDFLLKVNFVIFDEAHFSASQSFRKFGRVVPNAVYRLGLSATVRREDNKDLEMSAVCGEVVFDLETWKVENEGVIIMPRCFFIKNNDVELINDFQKSYEDNIVRGDERNKLVVDFCNVNKDKKILVLVNRVEHGEILNHLIEGSLLLNGEMSNKARESILESFADVDKNNVLIGTASIFNTGYNNPAIDVVFNVSGNAGFNNTIQTVGRVMRSCCEKGKERAFYVDFLDLGGVHQAHSWNRFKSLKSKNYSVKIVDDIYFIK